MEQRMKDAYMLKERELAIQRNASQQQINKDISITDMRSVRLDFHTKSYIQSPEIFKPVRLTYFTIVRPKKLTVKMVEIIWFS